ncbi:MAG: ABC transporter permease subunit [Candidatus Eisenbacteria sp.]|nr:ABC transporter permease subunit [Candidatus Eisenbacteria bacterium]
MRAVWVIAGREFRGFLRSPLGYALMAVYALAAGLLFVALLYFFREQLLRTAAQGGLGMAGPGVLSVHAAVVSPYLIDAASLLLFVLPFVTMRSFAEERRSRALEVLISYPLRVWQIVLGKYLGVVGFTLLLLAISFLHLVILGLISTADVLPILGGLAGLLLFSLALLAIGLFVSALAVGQVEAAVLTLGLFLVLAMGGGLARPGSSAIVTLLAHLSPLYHFLAPARGLLAPDGLLFFLGVTVLFLALTIRGVGLIKWRG